MQTHAERFRHLLDAFAHAESQDEESRAHNLMYTYRQELERRGLWK